MQIKNFCTEDEFVDILTDAQINAKAGWEEEFVDDIANRFDRFGSTMALTEKQFEKLRSIGND